MDYAEVSPEFLMRPASSRDEHGVPEWMRELWSNYVSNEKGNLGWYFQVGLDGMEWVCLPPLNCSILSILQQLRRVGCLNN